MVPWNSLPLVVAGLLVVFQPVFSHDHHHHHHGHNHRHLLQPDDDFSFSCGSEDSTDDDRDMMKMAVQEYDDQIARRGDAGHSENITVPVCFFVMIDKDGKNDRTDEQLQAQLDTLNTAFSASSCCNATLDWCGDLSPLCSVETGIRFAWAKLDGNGDHKKGETVTNVTDDGACAIRVNKHRWAKVRKNGIQSKHMKRALRKGGPEVLNVYWTVIGGLRKKSRIGGYATFPYSSKRPRLDGVVIRPDLITNGELENYKEGEVLAHETGHWLGLLHTFQDGCLASDGIADTPPEKEPFKGCGTKSGSSIGRDTCGGDGVPDAFFNIMNYAYSECMFAWTPGQAKVMKAAYNVYRLNKSFDDREVIALENGVASDPISLTPGERQIFSIGASDSIKCTTSSPEGDYGLYLKWDRPPFFRKILDNCVSKRVFHVTEKCRVRFGRHHDTLYAGIETRHDTPLQNMTLTCTYV